MVPMNTVIVQSFSAELNRLAGLICDTASWPSPGTGLALHLMDLSGGEIDQATVLKCTGFPRGPLDAAPAAATAGYAMCRMAPREEELRRWKEAIARLTRRDPFPRDRQTFAYRPSELVGLALGARRLEAQEVGAASWLRTVIEQLPSRKPQEGVWSVLLYHYSAVLLGVEYGVPLPGRLAEYDCADLGLMLTLWEKGGVPIATEPDPGSAERQLLERVLTEQSDVRDPERLSAIYSGLRLGLRACLARSGSPTAAQARPGQLAEQTQREPMKATILFLAANPSGSTKLALDTECRAIREKIRSSDHPGSLEFRSEWAVRPDDLLQYLNEFRPHVVHFSGHGSPAEQLILHDSSDRPKPVSREALRALFGTLKDNIRLVVLNACFSRTQGDTIVEVVDTAVGMRQAIGDNAAIVFAASFYRALGFGRSVKEAFEQGIAALLLEGIPENNTPVLLCRNGVDPARVYLVPRDRS